MTVKPVEAPPQASTSKSPQAPPAASGGGSSSSAVTKPPKKQKKTLKGVVVNKKPEKNTSSSSGALSTQSQSLDPSGVPAKRKQAETDTIDEKAPSTTAQSAKQSKKTKTDEPL